MSEELDMEQQMFLISTRTGADILAEETLSHLDDGEDPDLEHAALLSFLYEKLEMNEMQYAFVNYTAALVMLLCEARIELRKYKDQPSI